MNVSSFRLPRMDCPTEERLVRTALEGIEQIQGLEFDLPRRRLTVRHSGDARAVLALLVPLGFGAELEETGAATTAPPSDESGANESRVLWSVLVINAIMFVVELTFGLRARSSGLVADSLDMFADASVYGIALYAVGRQSHAKIRAARAAGWLQLALAIGAFGEVARRMLTGASPEPPTMIGVAIAALIANATCIALLFRHRAGGAHMRASYIFTTTDVLANIGVIASGALVAGLHAAWPDWVVGIIIASLVTMGAVRILRIGTERVQKV
jgi:Co/Zn/Cd efflux system component